MLRVSGRSGNRVRRGRAPWSVAVPIALLALSACDGSSDPFAETVGGNVLITVTPTRAAEVTSSPPGVSCDSSFAKVFEGLSEVFPDPDDRSGCRFGFLSGVQPSLGAVVADGFRIVGWSLAETGSDGEVPVLASYAGICPSNGTTCQLPEIETGTNYYVLLTLEEIPVVPPALGENLLVDPSFETLAYRTGTSPVTPGEVGFWKGDVGEIVSGTQANGIGPADGTRFIRCDLTGPFGPGAGSTGCEVLQVVDVSALASLIDAGALLASARFRANRVQLDAQTDRQFRVSLYAMSGPPADVPAEFLGGTYLESWDVNIVSDGDVATWETVELVNRQLPVGTRSLLVRLLAGEDVFNDADNTEFDGHYFDDASLVLIQR